MNIPQIEIFTFSQNRLPEPSGSPVSVVQEYRLRGVSQHPRANKSTARRTKASPCTQRMWSSSLHGAAFAPTRNLAHVPPHAPQHALTCTPACASACTPACARSSVPTRSLPPTVPAPVQLPYTGSQNASALTSALTSARPRVECRDKPLGDNPNS